MECNVSTDGFTGYCFSRLSALLFFRIKAANLKLPNPQLPHQQSPFRSPERAKYKSAIMQFLRVALVAVVVIIALVQAFQHEQQQAHAPEKSVPGDYRLGGHGDHLHPI